ncbi:MAG: DUF2974 domain-containing protein [Lachnospiraceae bacterium]|nr:DUF2974 domain-containing protein [Lachnospiraceae bacterium]
MSREEMTELSEQELLILSNYEYFRCSTNKGSIRDSIDKLKDAYGDYDINKITAEGATGDIITNEAAVDLLKRIENNEKLSGLSVARSIDRGGIRATLYTDKDNNATLVFRGTGGTYRAWKDNVTGEYETDTKLQRLAADFVKYECSNYDNITVTGHSKGGNMAQYVTVTCASQIDRCISYDGQGFGKNFRKKYENEIKNSKNKITSINGYNDFVNILLTPIAGNIIYVKNEESLGVNMHSCYTMLSNGSFDNNGNFNRGFGVIPQLPAMTMAKYASDGIVRTIDLLPEGGNEKASNILAAWTASMLSSNETEEYEQAQVTKAINDFKNYSRQLIGLAETPEHYVNCCCTYLNFKIDKIKEIYVLLDDARDKLLVYPELVEDLLVRLDYSILGRSFTENALKKVIVKLDRIIKMLRIYSDMLGIIIKEYEKADRFT